MPKSSEYWRKRFSTVEQSANDMSVEYVEELEKKYRRAKQDIQEKIDAWYGRFAKNNQISMSKAKKWLNSKELAELKWNVEEYIKHGKENAIDGRWEKELENASAKFHISRLEALKIECRQQVEKLTGGMADDLDKHLQNVYKDGCYRSMYEIQKGLNIGFDTAKLDDNLVKRVVNKPWHLDGSDFSSSVWNNKAKLVGQLDQELSRMVLTGASPDKAIRNIQKAMETSKNNASRLIMTEQAYFTTQAQRDTYKELDVEEYEVVATLDKHTCSVCGSFDGKHYPENEMQIGVNAPPFHPRCRCTTVPYFNDEFANGMRASRNEEGKTVYEVPEDMTYEEWKDGFVKDNAKDMKQEGGSYRKKSSLENENFKLYNNSNSDSVRPYNIEKYLKKNEFGQKALDYIKNNNVRINLCYGIDNPDDLLGEYDPVDDLVKIYCDKTKSVSETSAIIVHEIKHKMLKNSNLPLDQEEIECFIAEYSFRLGRELTETEKNDIIKMVAELYGF